MNFLLDTHAFIWWDSSPESLPKKVLSLFEDSGNSLFLSVASLWEMQIKTQLGKLSLSAGLSEIVSEQRDVNDLIILDIKPAHIYKLGNCPVNPV